MSDKKEKPIIMFPEGTLINHALYERDAYAKEGAAPGKPKYKVEMAFDPAQVEGENTIEDKMADAVADMWGEDAAQDFLDGKPGFVDPRLDGDRLALDREARGKAGDAYKGKLVIRADSIYNKDGVEGPGGMHVYGPDTSPIPVVEQDKVYSGCRGIMAATVHVYETEGKNERGQPIKLKGIKFYLTAFQKTADGERLVKASDRSSLFKPVAGAAAPGVAAAGRRRRAG